MKKVYLAIPYTGMEEDSYRIANEVVAKLLNSGYNVYSPISHGHSIAINNDLPTTWEFWSKIDQEFIEWCDVVVVVEIGVNGIELIKNSEGCQAEIMMAKKLNKEIDYIRYDKFDSEESIEAQRNFTRENKYPRFAPADGVCYNCNKNIYEAVPCGEFYSYGHSTEYAGKEHVTSCPHCSKCFCD